jgi:hypothetical protein
MDLLLGLEKRDAKKPSEKVEELAPTPYDEAADEFFEAHAKGDRKAARDALRSVIRICSMQDENHSDEEGT